MDNLPVVPESLFDIVNVEDPQVSPDGRMVTFVHMQPVEDGNTYRRSIWLAPVDGSGPAQPLTRSGKDHSPRWSPDGSRIAFVSNRSGNNEVYVIDPSGGEPRRAGRAAPRRTLGPPIRRAPENPRSPTLRFTASIAKRAGRSSSRRRAPPPARSRGPSTPPRAVRRGCRPSGWLVSSGGLRRRRGA